MSFHEDDDFNEVDEETMPAEIDLSGQPQSLDLSGATTDIDLRPSVAASDSAIDMRPGYGTVCYSCGRIHEYPVRAPEYIAAQSAPGIDLSIGTTGIDLSGETPASGVDLSQETPASGLDLSAETPESLEMDLTLPEENETITFRLDEETDLEDVFDALSNLENAGKQVLTVEATLR